MKITLLSKPGFSGGMLVNKIEEAASNRVVEVEVSLNDKLDDADVVLLTPQRESDLEQIKKVVKVPVDVITMKDYGLLNGDEILKHAKQLLL